MSTSILILEDDDSLRDLLVDILGEQGYNCLGACDCEEALILGEQIHFQMAISDIRMAGRLDGLGTMEILKQKNRNLGCIIITGYANDNAPSRAARIQADDYLYKPMDFALLLRTVATVANRSAERSRYSNVLKSFLAIPQQMLNAHKQDAILEKLDEQRTHVLQAYYLKIRAQDPQLTKTAARDLWDEIEELDVQFSLCFHHLKEFSSTILQAMQAQYQQIYEHLCLATQSHSLGSLRSRDQEQVERATFFRFYDRIQSGQISAEQFRLAAAVRRLHPSRRNEEVTRLHAYLWT